MTPGFVYRTEKPAVFKGFQVYFFRFQYKERREGPIPQKIFSYLSIFLFCICMQLIKNTLKTKELPAKFVREGNFFGNFGLCLAEPMAGLIGSPGKTSIIWC